MLHTAYSVGTYQAVNPNNVLSHPGRQHSNATVRASQLV